jgi:FtsP/CotA-like multicopper oxidase with cupredoxin domain
MNIAGRWSHWSSASCGAIALLTCLTPTPSPLEAQPSQAGSSGGFPERIAINDNRRVAGTATASVLTVGLEARLGTWHPDRETDPGVVVKAFGIDGGPLQIPGPVIRVREGTDIRVRVRNGLRDSLAVHGLYTRPGTPSSKEGVTVAPGEAREISFAAGRPGTYYYWAATAADTTLQNRVAGDSQLVGALIVDARDAPTDDRVLLISNWSAGRVGVIGRIAINGRSWPHTERLAYGVGETVRMRLINAGGAVHPMHLHGFYFRVDSRGDEFADTVFAPESSPRMVVTERLPAGRTFSLTWKPTRPGNWLFHCHDNVHLQRGIPLDGGEPSASHAPVANHAMEMMAGPVMGITVTGRSLDSPPLTSARRRQLRLVARVDQGGTEAEPAFGYTLHTGSKTDAAPPHPYLPGPTIVLKRGEPVSIIVENQLPEPTSVHWHGIELESYYDGVAGYAGEGQRIAPPIPSGGTFDARFTPPRSGTFIYHTHIDEVRQQQAGLSGALLVVDDRAAYDRERDMVLLVSVPRRDVEAAKVVLLNGSSTPAVKEMRVGVHYRLRFINIHTFRAAMRMRLLRDSTLLEWRAVAKDGMELPGDQAITSPSEIQMGNGETYDFDFAPSTPGNLHVDVTNAAGVLLVSMPIHVR